ncbi:MAG: hypothetical protein JSV63_03190 [Candidatus Aenigmatarchaeota archaeon]|nr:MAG: hypothetical protein JSV63_03190 [Candidatus Aenigmarchaeota archaeon]
MKETLLYGTIAILLLLVFSVVIAEGASTTVETRPGRISSLQYDSVKGTIIIETDSPGDYEIKILGVPDSWLLYDADVYVAGRETVTYVLSPQQAGSYILEVYVKGPEDYSFQEEVRLWVGKKGAPDIPEPEAEEDSVSGGLEGMITFAEQNQLVLMGLAILIAAIFAVLLAYRSLKVEEPHQG